MLEAEKFVGDFSQGIRADGLLSVERINLREIADVMGGWQADRNHLHGIVTANGTAINLGYKSVTFESNGGNVRAKSFMVDNGSLTTYQGILEAHLGKPMLLLVKNGLLATRVEIFEDEAYGMVVVKRRFDYGPIDLGRRQVQQLGVSESVSDRAPRVLFGSLARVA